jgi:hypothetical protein
MGRHLDASATATAGRVRHQQFHCAVGVRVTIARCPEHRFVGRTADWPRPTRNHAFLVPPTAGHEAVWDVVVQASRASRIIDVISDDGHALDRGNQLDGRDSAAQSEQRHGR